MKKTYVMGVGYYGSMADFCGSFYDNSLV